MARRLLAIAAPLTLALAASACAPQSTVDEGLLLCDGAMEEGCVAAVSDTLGLTYAAREDGYDFTLLALEDGEALQSFDEERGNALSGPYLEDFDQDGDPELIIPDFTGNVNTAYRIRQLIDGRFEPAGEVSGLGLERDEESGLLGISSRSSAVSYGHHVYVLSDDGLVLVYALESDLADRACVLTPGPAFDAAGQTADALLSACEAGL